MPYSKSKSIKRFSFGVNSNPDSHKAGANTVSISTRDVDGYYSTASSSMTMTFKEATALQGFLNKELGGYVSSGGTDDDTDTGTGTGTDSGTSTDTTNIS